MQVQDTPERIEAKSELILRACVRDVSKVASLSKSRYVKGAKESVATPIADSHG